MCRNYFECQSDQTTFNSVIITTRDHKAEKLIRHLFLKTWGGLEGWLLQTQGTKGIEIVTYVINEGKCFVELI